MRVAEIVCAPYSSILNPEVRSRLGININNAIVIFDEAHNLIEQELSIKSPEVSYSDLLCLTKRIDEYK